MKLLASIRTRLYPTPMDPTFKAALRKGLIGFVISRICVLGGAAIVAAQEVVEINDAKGVRPSNASKLLMNVFAGWDGVWYLRIVRLGYPRHIPEELTYHDLPARAAFFPLYPTIVRAADKVLPGGDAVAGVTVNLFLSLVAIGLIGLLTFRLWGARVAERSMLLTALFPGAFVLSFVYAEALLLVLAAGCLLLLQRERWLAAGLLAALATATRPNGLGLVAACAVAAYFAIRDDRKWRSLIAPLLAPLGFIGFQLFLWHQTGERGAWFRVQRVAWDEGASFGGSALAATLDFFRKPLSSPADSLTAISLATTIVLVVAAWKTRLSWAPAAYSAVVIALMVIPSTVTARPRFLYTAFPLLIAYAKWRDDDDADRWAFTYTLCGAGLVVLTAMYGVRGAIP
ncbi:MAG: mannosyltransferase family protein [Ilumatobacteraceae bacterium]